MSDSSSTVQRGGMGVLGWLTVIFVVLKLNPGGHLDSPVENWSWWGVLAPTWVPLAIVLLILVGLGIAWLVVRLLEAQASRKRRKAREKRLAAEKAAREARQKELEERRANPPKRII